MGILRNINRNYTQQYYNILRLSYRIKTGKWPPQIVFLHVPKTGGTTIQYQFAKYLGSARQGRVCRFDSLYGKPDQVNIERARKARYVGGHLDWDTAQHFMQPDAYTFTVLRDPFDRFVSTYLYLTNFPPEFLGQNTVAHLQGMDIDTFIRSDDSVVRLWTDNLMTRQFGGSFSSREVTDDMVSRSLERLRTISFIGFQHRLDDDFRKIATACAVPLPSEVRHANVTVKDPRKETVLKRLRGDLAPLLDKKIAKDIEIYSRIRKEFGS